MLAVFGMFTLSETPDRVSLLF